MYGSPVAQPPAFHCAGGRQPAATKRNRYGILLRGAVWIADADRPGCFRRGKAAQPQVAAGIRQRIGERRAEAFDGAIRQAYAPAPRVQFDAAPESARGERRVDAWGIRRAFLVRNLVEVAVVAQRFELWQQRRIEESARFLRSAYGAFDRRIQHIRGGMPLACALVQAREVALRAEAREPRVHLRIPLHTEVSCAFGLRHLLRRDSKLDAHLAGHRPPGPLHQHMLSHRLLRRAFVVWLNFAGHAQETPERLFGPSGKGCVEMPEPPGVVFTGGLMFGTDAALAGLWLVSAHAPANTAAAVAAMPMRSATIVPCRAARPLLLLSPAVVAPERVISPVG